MVTGRFVEPNRQRSAGVGGSIERQRRERDDVVAAVLALFVDDIAQLRVRHPVGRRLHLLERGEVIDPELPQVERALDRPVDRLPAVPPALLDQLLRRPTRPELHEVVEEQPLGLFGLQHLVHGQIPVLLVARPRIGLDSEEHVVVIDVGRRPVQSVVDRVQDPEELHAGVGARVVQEQQDLVARFHLPRTVRRLGEQHLQ
ncbi:hypothetical protein [Halobellus ruber]|uniref:Uncharacterized protein n=1 Tax=Halobellus ruber TaxID=2761102 RepID=A0A7J9SN17_9EURY|nr:hypothetical protein [Halobellus ruber]